MKSITLALPICWVKQTCLLLGQKSWKLDFPNIYQMIYEQAQEDHQQPWMCTIKTFVKESYAMVKMIGCKLISIKTNYYI